MAQPRIPVEIILSKLAEDAEKAQERAKKASNIFLEELETDIAVTPYDIVHEEDRVKLKHYRAVKESTLKTPLLVSLHTHSPSQG